MTVPKWHVDDQRSAKYWICGIFIEFFIKSNFVKEWNRMKINSLKTAIYLSAKIIQDENEKLLVRMGL